MRWVYFLGTSTAYLHPLLRPEVSVNRHMCISMYSLCGGKKTNKQENTEPQAPTQNVYSCNQTSGDYCYGRVYYATSRIPLSLLSVLNHKGLHSGATGAGSHPSISTAPGPQGALLSFPPLAEDRGTVEE